MSKLRVAVLIVAFVATAIAISVITFESISGSLATAVIPIGFLIVGAVSFLTFVGVSGAESLADRLEARAEARRESRRLSSID